MSQSLVTYGSDRRLVLSNGEAIRAPIYLDDWNTIRIGMLITCHASAAVAGTPRFAFGVCAGTLGYGAVTGTPHVLGIRTENTSWSFTANSGNSYVSPNSTSPKFFTRVGSTFTTTAGVSGGFSLISAKADFSFRSPVFIEIQKGTPNYTLYHGGASNAFSAAQDYSEATFLSMMETSTLAGIVSIDNKMAASAGTTIAVDEATNGILDHIFVFWDRSTPVMSIGAIAHRRVA